MKTRHTIATLLALLVLAIASVGAFFLLAARGELPPALSSAYATVESLASSATTAFAAPRTVAERTDAGAAEPAAARKTQAAPLSSSQLGAPLVHGKFVTECGAPDDMKVVVKVTVKMGRPVAVSAATTPPSVAVASCVEKATREMQWDVSPKAQHLTVTY